MKWIKALLFLSFLTCLAQQVYAQATPCVYTLDLNDLLGDGWNGSQLEVRINNTATTYTITNGSKARHYLTLNNGDSLRLTYKPGPFDLEVSYSLLDQEGKVVYTTGTDLPKAGITLRTRIICPTCAAPPGPSLVFEDVRAFSAQLSWLGNVVGGTYLLEYGKKGFLPNKGQGTTLRTAVTRVILKTLTQNTNYDLYLSLICSNPADTSQTLGPFAFKTRFAIDLGISGIESPTTECGLERGDTVRVLIHNFGGEPQSLVPFKYAVNGMPVPISMPKDGVYTGVVGRDSSEVAEFDNKYSFPPGDYYIDAWTEIKGDSVPRNDTLRYTFTSLPTITSFPYVNLLEDSFTGWTVDQKSVNASWQLGTPNKRVLNTAFSGNQVWATKLNGSYNSSEVSYLASPCFNFSKLTADPVLTFATQLDLEGCCDGMWVELSTDGGVSWAKLGDNTSGINWYNDVTRQIWNGNGGVKGWFTASHPLPGTATAPNVRIRFAFLSDFANNLEGALIDNIQIHVPTRDLLALSVRNTSADACGNSTDQLAFALGNLSRNNATAFSVAYRINNGAVVTENVGGFTLAPNAKNTYTFKGTFNSATPGTYNIKAWVVGDVLASNDTAYFSFNTAYPVPFGEDFERGGIPRDWTIDADAVVVKDRGNNSFTLSDNLFSGDVSLRATTPVFGPIAANDSLTFEYRYVNVSGNTVTATQLTANDRLDVLVSTDCGRTFVVLQSITAANHLSSTQLRRITVKLGAYANRFIQIRLAATWGGGDYWIDLDNINLNRCPAKLNLSSTTRNATGATQRNGSASVRGEANGAPYKFKWNTGATSAQITQVPAGKYSVTVTDRFGCSSVLDLDVKFTVSARDQELPVDNLSIAPNPTNEQTLLRVSLRERTNLQVQLINTVGQVLSQVQLGNVLQADVPINLANLPAGMYFLRLQGNGRQRIERVVKF
jgi:hypothetical protein